MADEHFQEILPHEKCVNLLESKPDNVLGIRISENFFNLGQSVSVSKSDEQSSFAFNSSTNHSLFVCSSNESESDPALVSNELNNLSGEAFDSNVIGSDESNVYTMNEQFNNHVSENVDDDCYIVGSFKSTTPIQDRSNQCISYVECVDLTQDEPEETKFPNSLAHEFTKDTRLCILLDVIPDADPDFLMRKVNEFKTDNDLQLFVLNALETQNYPKIGTVSNILSNQTLGNVRDPDYFLNKNDSRYDFTSSLNSSTSQQSALKDDSITTHFADLNSTNFASSLKEKNRDQSVFKISTTVIPEISHTATSISSADTSVSQKLLYANALVDMKHHSFQRHVQSKINVVGAKPHTVTSQKTYVYTSPNIPQSVTAHTEGRYPEPSVQDIKLSQPGVGRLGTSFSTYIPNRSFVSSTQTGNHENPVNTNVNVPAHSFTSSLHIITPNTRTPHATYNAPLPPRPENFFQNIRGWVPLSINIFNPTETNDPVTERRRQYYQEYRRHHKYFNVAPHHLENNMMENMAGSLSDTSKAKGENQCFNLLADILNWADLEFLRRESNKLRNDDDIEKFLIRAIANEELWSKCVNIDNSAQRILPGSPSDNKFKILLELLPDANPKFLKRESAKLKNDKEVHELAMKLGREQTYPKRRNSNSSAKNKSIKRKLNEISDPEAIDPNYQTLLDMLPDADPDFLLQESKMLKNPDDLEEFVLKAVEDNIYPKRDQFLERQEYQKQWKKYIENFNIKEFLKVVPNPVKYFYIDKVNPKNPLDMPETFLQHRYKRKCTQSFVYFFTAAKHNLTKTCDILDAHFQTKPRKFGAWDQKTIFSTSILQEIAFIQNKKEIAHYLLFKEEMKLEAYEKGKTEGTLVECSCCCDDKLSEDMTSCFAGHIYCLNCIRRGSEVVIGNGGTKFPCYSEGCKEEFSLDILKTVLNPEVFSRLLIRKQYEEVNAAGIPGLETCSFCEFCSIPPAEDKLFRCLNPSCMKVTCRSCKKVDHLPLSCEEFSQKETMQKMQSYVEDKMTEALVRTCWQCGTKFIKEIGCNMMQCKCGAKMCYFCRQPIENYHHFIGGRCGQHLDTTAHDEAAVLKVGKKAKQEVEAANPGYRLKNDPTELLLKKST